MTTFINNILHGLTYGALCALVAVGYTMVYGVIQLINFAHGEFYMAGGFVGMLGLIWLCGPGRPLSGLPGEAQLLLGVLLAAVAVAGLAALVERVAYRPIRASGRIAALLAAVGLSLLLQNAGIAVFGSGGWPFPETLEDARYPRRRVDLEALAPGEVQPQEILYRLPLPAREGFAPGGRGGYQRKVLVEAGRPLDPQRLAEARAARPDEVYAYPAVTITLKQLLVLAALQGSALLLYVVVAHTRTGRAMRAVAHDHETASLMGIDAGQIVRLTFVLGGFCAGVGGVLAGGMYIGKVDPMMGFLFGLKAFIAAVLGGIGSIPGALLGGLALGLLEQLTQYYADELWRGAGSYRDAFAFLVLIAVLLARPQGFFGKYEGEKV